MAKPFGLGGGVWNLTTECRWRGELNYGEFDGT
jgi:hypothetical protein